MAAAAAPVFLHQSAQAVMYPNPMYTGSQVTGVLNTANGRFEFVTSLRKLFVLRPRGRAGAAGAAARKDRGRACLGAGVSYLSGSDDVLCGLVRHCLRYWRRGFK